MLALVCVTIPPLLASCSNDLLAAAMGDTDLHLQRALIQVSI
ncbi:MAG: hypothetical protein QNJ46_17435 [Leptolyngbyaceae cyanobacterium MO_188.B28]|nr:hypothetical protein [Leptolyngbyaceae cyanobacterium MO_188.B28]